MWCRTCRGLSYVEVETSQLNTRTECFNFNLKQGMDAVYIDAFQVSCVLCLILFVMYLHYSREMQNAAVNRRSRSNGFEIRYISLAGKRREFYSISHSLPRRREFSKWMFWVREVNAKLIKLPTLDRGIFANETAFFVCLI